MSAVANPQQQGRVMYSAVASPVGYSTGPAIQYVPSPHAVMVPSTQYMQSPPSPYNPQLVQTQPNAPYVLPVSEGSHNQQTMYPPHSPAAPQEPEAISLKQPEPGSGDILTEPGSGAAETSNEEKRTKRGRLQSVSEHFLNGRWWKCIIVLFIIFVIVFFVVFIGPRFIWNNNSEDQMDSVPMVTLSPTVEPTVDPTAAPTMDPTPQPNTRAPTQIPTACPFQLDTYWDNELCDITAVAIGSCDDVEFGEKYLYDMKASACQEVIECTSESLCFNSTHYFDGMKVNKASFAPAAIGDDIMCSVLRECETGVCLGCDSSYRNDISVLILISQIILALCCSF